MSPRQPVDQQRIEHFLQQLGKQFTKPGVEFKQKFEVLTEMWRNIQHGAESTS